jgi:nucleoside-diphosphate-sugar epimerase
MAMGSRILLAGACGAIGRRLTPLLLDAGHTIVGTTRSAAKAERLRRQGVEPAVVDVFDMDALVQVLVSARPEIVIHQLTDLPPGVDPSRMAEAIAGNARIRDLGTRNLVQAALAAGSRRMIGQSIAWAYAEGPRPYAEDAPLDEKAEGSRAITVKGVMALERQILASPPLEGTVLRYGRLYGPGTGVDAPPASMPLHVDAAAHAALLALDREASGIFNIAEPNREITTEKAVAQLGWNAEFRLPA